MEINFRKPHLASLRINTIARIYGCKTYLEIGVHSGETFFRVNIENKFAVDPTFQFDIEQYKDKNSHFFSMTSDEFFNILNKTQKHSLKFDIVFIDGLHTHEQSLRDFENSLEFTHNNTIWIFDDTIPTSPFSAIPDYNTAVKFYRKIEHKGMPWHGDVYKTVMYLHDYFSEFCYCSLVHKSQTVVWKTTTPQQRKKIFSSTDEIKNLSYFDMLRYADKFNPIEESMLPVVLGKNLQPSYPENIWELFLPKLSDNRFID